MPITTPHDQPRPTMAGRPASRDLIALFLLSLLWLAATSPAHAAAAFTVSFDRTVIPLGETATMTMTFDGGTIKGLPAPPRIPNLNFSSSQGQSSSTSIINGQVSSSESFSFIVTPTQPGEYTIPAMTAEISGFPATSRPVKLTVVKSAAAAAAAPNQTAFIRLRVPREKVYVGEVFPAQFELYLRDGVVNLQNFQMSQIQAEGFTVSKPTQSQQSQTQVDGVGYTIIPMTIAFTAVKAGTLSLGPITCNMDLLFGPVDFFGRPTRQQHYTVSNDVVTIESLPLPRENVPPGFNGAVGSYTLALNASPTNIAVGDPLTVTIQISGHGSLDSVTLPDQSNWQQFKVYPPTSDIQLNDQLGISGTKTFKLTAVPENLELRELPPFVFSFFDSEKGTYHTLTGPAVPLTVRPSAASLPPPTLADANTASGNPPASKDLAPNKPLLGAVGQFQPPLVTRPWFLGLQTVPVLAWLCLFVQRKQKENLAANPRLRRQREVEGILRDGLKELHQSAAANDPAAFFATLFHLLQERLGERLDLPASAITEAVVEERLRPLNVPDYALDLLRELFQACNQARYAPQSTNEELLSLIAKVETALNDLKQLKS